MALLFAPTTELRHGLMSFSAHTGAPDNEAHGPEDNDKIEPNGLVVDIPCVKGEPLFPRNPVPAVDDGPPREPGLDLMSSSLFGRIPANVRNEQRPWTHDAHIARDDVDEFGEFVKRR